MRALPSVMALAGVLLASTFVAAPGGATFSTPVLVATGTAEPGLVLNASNGNDVWVHYPGGLSRSVDGGGNFSAVNFGAALVMGGDADVVLARDGSIYYSDLESLASISVISSHDNGTTWLEQPVASDSVGDDRQWLAVGKDAAPWPLGGGEAVYLAYNALAAGPVVTKSTDGGLTWTPYPVFATANITQLDFWSIGNVVVDGNGVLYVPYTLGSAGSPYTPPLSGAYTVAVSVSTNGGLTWTRHDVASSSAIVGNLFASAAVDVNGTAYLAWSMTSGSTTDIYMSRSANNGTSWSTPLRVNANDGSHVMPWISAGDAGGEIALAWYEASETVAPGSVTGDWNVRVAYSRNGDASTPTFAEADATGTVFTGGICVYGITCSGGRELLDFFQVRIGGDDKLHVAYASYSDAQNVYYTRSSGALS